MTTEKAKLGRPSKIGRPLYRSTDWLSGRWDMQREYIAQLCREGKIPAVKIGRTWLIRLTDVEALEAVGAKPRPKRQRRPKSINTCLSPDAESADTAA